MLKQTTFLLMLLLTTIPTAFGREVKNKVEKLPYTIEIDEESGRQGIEICYFHKKFLE